MNYNYGKLIDGIIEFAPDKLETQYGTIDNPNEQNYLFYGWKKIIEGAGFGDFGYYQTDTEIIKIHATTAYGKLVDSAEVETDSAVEFAPEVLIHGGDVIENPTAEQYLADGYKACVDANGATKFLENDTTIYGVWTNSMFGKLEDGIVTFADDKLLVDGEIVLAPTEEQYNAIGFYEIVDNPLPPQEGYDVVEDGWEVVDNKLTKKYKYVKLPDPIYEYSKLKILVQIKQLGYWEQVKAWIQGADLWDEYLACQSFKSDNEYFKQGLAAIKEAIPELTDEVINEVLRNAILDADAIAALRAVAAADAEIDADQTVEA